MKKIGTALEWFQQEPEALITNRKLLQVGVSVRVTGYYPDGVECTYESSLPGGEPRIWFGNKCPYLVRGTVQFVVHAMLEGSGGLTALSTDHAMDPNWEKVE